MIPPKYSNPLPLWHAAILVVAGGAAYAVAFATHFGAAAVLIALPCVFLLARLRSSRKAFYAGLAAGVAMYVPHLMFFWSIFGPMASALWLIAAIPIGVFVLLLHLAHRRLGATWALGLTPMLWTGIEYFRSELYYLRFAWLLPGQATAFLPGVRLASVGVYGLGFLYALASAMILGQRTLIRAISAIAAIAFAVLMYVPPTPRTNSDAPLHVAGVQLESPEPADAADALDRLATAYPEAQILVLSEYTFRGPVPQVVRDVLRKHQRYLVAGGIKYLPGGLFHDTAFVVGPDGRDVFEQGKSVPVQFMGDGLPAAERHVWHSPWGKIGIAVCYDVSYANVMDDFVREGAQGFIVPTMDMVDWGEYERRQLHGRLAPIRSAEYGIPTFGVWSSGVSQLIDARGQVIASASYPGQGEMIAGPFPLRAPGRVPPDRWLARGASAGTGLFIVYVLVCGIRQWIRLFRPWRAGKLGNTKAR